MSGHRAVGHGVAETRTTRDQTRGTGMVHGEEQPEVKDCRAIDGAKSRIGRKRTEQNIHGSNLEQPVRLLLWDHRAING